MNLIKIDVIGLKASEGISDMLANFVSRDTGFFIGDSGIRHRPIYLCCQDDLIPTPATLFEPATNDFFGLSSLWAISIGSIKEVDALVQRFIHDAAGFVFRCITAKVHRSETDFAHSHI